MLVLGLMSGTSLDGIDAAIIDTDGESYIHQVAYLHKPYVEEFQHKLRNICAPGNNSLHNLCTFEHQLTTYHAEVALELISQTNIDKNTIEFIGFPGQTIYHAPDQGVTWQIGNPHLLKALTGIKVVADFRRSDVALSGQGAPLVPIFHKAIVQNQKYWPVAVLNIGGVANVTYIDKDCLIAFDTGPGNALINDMMMHYYNKPYDDGGAVAKTGIISQDFIDHAFQDSYFNQAAPKSLDRNHFSYLRFPNNVLPQNIIATLTAFTVQSIIKSFELLPKQPAAVYVCGGGIKNHAIMDQLKAKLQSIMDIDTLGFDHDFIEAQAFAYLAARSVRNLPSTFPLTTGVLHPAIIGTIF